MSAFGLPSSFEAPIDRFGVGRERKIWYNVLFLPPALENVLPFAVYPRLRVEGEIADVPFEGGWIPTGDGRRYVIVSPRILRDARTGVGEIVEMRFKIADQTAVDVPAELLAALRENPDVNDIWRLLTPGKRRAFTHRVHGTKSASTRARRVAEIIAALRD